MGFLIKLTTTCILFSRLLSAKTTQFQIGFFLPTCRLMILCDAVHRQLQTLQEIVRMIQLQTLSKNLGESF